MLRKLGTLSVGGLFVEQTPEKTTLWRRDSDTANNSVKATRLLSLVNGRWQKCLRETDQILSRDKDVQPVDLSLTLTLTPTATQPRA